MAMEEKPNILLPNPTSSYLHMVIRSQIIVPLCKKFKSSFNRYSIWYLRDICRYFSLQV